LTNSDTNIDATGPLGGSLTVDASKVLQVPNNPLRVGFYGAANLNISNGGIVSNYDGLIGDGAGSNGTVTVDNGTWTNTRILQIGSRGTGILNVAAGGSVSATTLNMAEYASSIAQMTIGGTGASANVSGSMYVGGASSAGGTATVTVNAGGMLNVGGANTL
jgi:T5SS/PEP-CTERM-associated repeat protein